MSYNIYFMERFNRLTIGHFLVIDCGYACINLTGMIQDQYMGLG